MDFACFHGTLASCPTAPKADMIGRADVDAAKMAADQARMQADAVMAEKAENLEVAHDRYNIGKEAL